MKATASFVIQAPIEDAFAVLLDPRNLLTANHRKPIVEQSDPPTATGSWAVIALDQLRARIDYTTVERPTRIVATVGFSGRGSGNRRTIQTYELRAAGPAETHVSFEIESTSGSSIARLTWPLAWRLFRRGIAQAAARR